MGNAISFPATGTIKLKLIIAENYIHIIFAGDDSFENVHKQFSQIRKNSNKCSYEEYYIPEEYTFEVNITVDEESLIDLREKSYEEE